MLICCFIENIYHILLENACLMLSEQKNRDRRKTILRKFALVTSMIVISLFLVQISFISVSDYSIVENTTDISPINEIQYSQTSWLEGWRYRKMHNFSGGPDAGNNFQMSFTVHYGNGADDSEDVYCNSHCRTDFGDLRFTSADGITEYDYWIQNFTIGVQALFWVEITEYLNVSRTIYVYYGQATVTTTSNGIDTFRYFDDFSRADSETVGNGWTEDENSTEVALTDESLRVSGPLNRYAHVERSSPAIENLVLEGNIYASSNEIGDSASALCLYWSDHVWVRVGWRSVNEPYTSQPEFFTQENDGDGASGGSTHIPGENGNRAYRFRIVLSWTVQFQYSLDDGYTWNLLPMPMTRADEYSGAPSTIIVGRGYSDSPSGLYPNSDLDNIGSEIYPDATSYIDDIFVRNTCVYLPHHDDYGSEEINPAVDFTAPILSHPEDIHFVEGETNYEITWLCSDENPLNYSVWKDDAIIGDHDWYTSPINITVTLDGLSAGVYTYTAELFDSSGNRATDEVQVTVTSNVSSAPFDLLLVGLIGSGALIIVVVLIVKKR